MDHLMEKTIEKKVLFQGQVITLRLDKVRLPNGKEASREVVTHPGAACVVPLTDQGEVILVRQWRHPLERLSLEIPAGKLSVGEDPLLCAQRELAEETGFQAMEWHHLFSYYASPGFCNEKIHIYKAYHLIPSEARPDEDEFIESLTMPLDEALEKIQSGEIFDGKTITALIEVARQK
ncbi:NUDIX domain-containing protein [Heliorestis convoluta]|uniref:ADP-ribose pyrophosphatase n=1 Tax=Heliorestis convoluta TaxID=356322 RepID=A0A5Q2MYR1_9FIRM|nr:NUDIX hydrolase [Heliorestis convoluta]QGG46529.1 ADP-ribose pyrophosphatase [Heliorestis convoluta]